jgi:hypothetical protein
MSCSSGANHDDTRGYMPHITSYDYGAPVTESGLYNEKFTVLYCCGPDKRLSLPSHGMPQAA